MARIDAAYMVELEQQNASLQFLAREWRDRARDMEKERDAERGGNAKMVRAMAFIVAAAGGEILVPAEIVLKDYELVRDVDGVQGVRFRTREVVRP